MPKKGKGHNHALSTLPDYYTPKTIIFQGILNISTIFVNNADFYVNAIMSTNEMSRAYCFTNIDFKTIC